MLSILFCQFGGGIITALESGQDNSQSMLDASGELNVKEKILQLLDEKDGIVLVTEYIDELKIMYPEYNQFLELLAIRESSGEYYITSASSKYLGRYQIGPETLKQIGFMDENRNWIDLANRLGVNSHQDFLNNEIAQEVAILFALRWDYQFILSNGDNQYIGQTIEGKEVTVSGLIAAYHLVGNGTMHKALSGQISWEKAKDGNRVSGLTYMEEMGGLNLDGILGGIGQ